MKRLAVLGGGSFGTVLALVTAGRFESARVWCHHPALAREVETRRVNEKYIPGAGLPANVHFTASLEEALEAANLVLIAVPTEAVRTVVREARALVAEGAPVVSAAKGIEIASGHRVSEILEEELPGAAVAVVSGPNLAREMADGKPTGAVVAARDPAVAKAVQAALATSRFRLYSSTDVVGVEVGGALKNVIAIGAGIVHGMELGENSTSFLMTRGLAEIRRYGVRLGAKPLTFDGLSGMGDLIATCASPLSRNHRVGAGIALGETLEQVLSRLGMVAEGVPTTRAARAAALRLGVEMPITREIHAVLFEGKNAQAAVVDLMTRDLKSEEEFS